jgi:hypothetical protein
VQEFGKIAVARPAWHANPSVWQPGIFLWLVTLLDANSIIFLWTIAMGMFVRFVFKLVQGNFPIYPIHF